MARNYPSKPSVVLRCLPFASSKVFERRFHSRGISLTPSQWTKPVRAKYPHIWRSSYPSVWTRLHEAFPSIGHGIHDRRVPNSSGSSKQWVAPMGDPLGRHVKR